MTIDNLIIIDQRIKNVDLVKNSINENTEIFLVDSTTTEEYLLNHIKGKTYTSVGYFSHYQAPETHSITPDVTYNLENDKDALVNFWTKFETQTVDYLGCSTLKNEVWKNTITYLEEKTSKQFRASDDNTGNLEAGGDWVLESDGVNVKDLYFTEEINVWMGLLGAPVAGADNFVSTWAVSAGTFELPLKDYANITIDWGDSGTSTHTGGVFPTHTYSSSGTKTITVAVNDVAKDIGQMYMNNHASRTLIRTVENWGEGKWETFYVAFKGATHLTIPATDEPDLSYTTSMVSAFQDCSSLVGTTLSDWDTASVTSMIRVFEGASAFNGNISSWNTASVTSMVFMFSNTNSFNQDISSWNTAAVTNMGGMFQGAAAFNQNISNWHVQTHFNLEPSNFKVGANDTWANDNSKQPVWDAASFPLLIGDTHQGGIIFYLDGHGGGLIAAPTDQSKNSAWGCYGTSIVTGSGIVTGAQNTINIEAECTTSGTAAAICANLTLGGYSDWFLPSKDELNQMYLNIGGGSDLGNVGNFSTNTYWSSTEEDVYMAWRLDFDYGSKYYDYKNINNVSVRAVRAFSVNSDTTAPVITVTPGTDTVEQGSTWTDAGATSDGGETVTASGTVDETTAAGTYTITYTAIDAAENVGTATRTVNVVDTTPPVIITQDLSVQLDANGTATITAAEIDGGSSDNFDYDLTLDKTTFGCGDVGNNTVTLTGTDSSGNTSTGYGNVVVEDNIAPVIITQDLSVQLDANGTATITVAEIDGGSSDNCSYALALDKTTFDRDDIGNNTVTLTGTDSSGNTSTAVAIVTVVDNIAPVITVTPGTDTVEQGSTWTDQGATADGSEKVTVSGIVDTSIAGTYTITYTATDASGNVGTATRTVTVEDTTAPVITVTPGTDTVEQGSTWTDAGATSDGGETVTASGTVDETTAAGTYTITYTATDASGNVGTATRTVTVEDTTAPVITLIGESTVTIEHGSTYTDAGATANTGETVTAVGSVDTSVVDTYTITYTATDASENIGTATRTVNVLFTINNPLLSKMNKDIRVLKSANSSRKRELATIIKTMYK